MKIIPLRDRILIKRLGGEEKTKGGIIIPNMAKEKPMQGMVLAVGKGKVNNDGELIALEVKEGGGHRALGQVCGHRDQD